jgi:hypothetical protein
MNWLLFMIGILGTWRFTHLLVVEDGPWDVLVRLRRRLSKTFIGKLLDCFYCSSLWVSILFAMLLGHTLTDRFILWPALSAGAILLENLSARLDQPAAAAYVVEGDQNHELLRQDQRDGKPGE